MSEQSIHTEPVLTGTESEFAHTLLDIVRSIVQGTSGRVPEGAPILFPHGIGSIELTADIQSQKINFTLKIADATGKTLEPTAARLSTTEPAHFDLADAATGISIDDLNLVDYAKTAAQKLLSDFPDVVFTSGRRDVSQQASAMAGNVAQNRNWIKATYKASPERDSLQAWVDSNPDATTADTVAAGLAGVMNTWTDTQKQTLSRRFSGQAFDVQPMSGSHGDDVKAGIKALPNLRKFFDNEGGLIIWHADFEVTASNT